jgi:hypothetical protein
MIFYREHNGMSHTKLDLGGGDADWRQEPKVQDMGNKKIEDTKTMETLKAARVEDT